ncbi:MAG: MFS transporter [bacterium]
MLRSLRGREKHTFTLAMWAYMFNGMVVGILILQEVILKKTFSGSALEITILTMIMPVSNLFSIYFAPLIKRTVKKAVLFYIIGIAGRFSLIFISLISSGIPFIAILFVYYAFNALFNPLINHMIQVNISRDKRGMLFGFMNALSTLTALLISLLAGLILDMNENFYRLIFAAGGLTGLYSAYLFSRIRINKKRLTDNALQFVSSRDIMYPLKNMIHIFRQDPYYFFFESSFFIYGLGFISILPALPIYFVDVMGMDYSQISIAKGVVGQLFMVLIMPFAGRFHDRSNPILLSSAVFFILALYPLILVIAPMSMTIDPVHFVYLSFLIYSLAMSGVIIVWNLGSIFFAGNNHASDYQSIHITLTGVRGLIAPFIGLFVMKVFGVFYVFYLSSAFFLIAGISMMILSFFYRRKQREISPAVQ